MFITHPAPGTWHITGFWTEDNPFTKAVHEALAYPGVKSPDYLDGDMDVTVQVVKHGNAIVTFNDGCHPTPYWHDSVTVQHPHEGWTVWCLDVAWEEGEWEVWFDAHFSGGTFDGCDGDSCYIINPVPKQAVYGLIGFAPAEGMQVVIPAVVLLSL